MKNGLVIDSYGNKWWYLNDMLHREDGPAVELLGGTKEWWIKGKRHREDGPACEWTNGTKSWFFNGLLHREDGPAVEWVNEDKEWWYNGERMSLEDFERIVAFTNHYGLKQLC